MAGTPGNPNHDPKTGRFASSSGLNKSNSTIGQRGKAKVKEGFASLGTIAATAAGVAVGGVGAALLKGVTIPAQRAMHAYAQKGISTLTSHAERIAAAHGPKIISAIQAKGSTLVNHVKNMKIAGKTQHNVSSISSRSSSFKSPSQLKTELSSIRSPSAKPRVRIPMGRK